MKIVLVKWKDAASLGGWRTKKQMKVFIDGDLDPVHSVGMLVHDDEKKVVLIQTHGVNSVIGLFEIPRGCITEMTEIGTVET